MSEEKENPMKCIVLFVEEIRTPFVLSDIRRLSDRYAFVFLLSAETLEGKDALPKNVQVCEAYMDWKQFKPFRILSANWYSIFGIYVTECIRLRKILTPARSVALLVSNIFKADSAMQALKRKAATLDMKDTDFFRNSTFYSFWFYDCIYLAWLKKKGLISKAISRAHGGDLFEDRTSLKGKILFRHFQLNYLDAVLPISETGRSYLKKQYPEAKAEIKTVFLGSVNHGINPFPPEIFTLVSCASLRHHKRIHRIAEMLQYIDFPIRWIHFGDENLNSDDPKIEDYKINKEKLKGFKNIEYMPMGLTPNEAILDFYSRTPVSLFISLSSVEGIPVSIMEAISFGIPVLSTNVGGCSEIVTEQTGILIPLETDMKSVADQIRSYRHSDKNTALYRSGVRAFWEKHFDAEINYNEFFKTSEHNQTWKTKEY